MSLEFKNTDGKDQAKFIKYYLKKEEKVLYSELFFGFYYIYIDIFF